MNYYKIKNARHAIELAMKTKTPELMSMYEQAANLESEIATIEKDLLKKSAEFEKLVNEINKIIS